MDLIWVFGKASSLGRSEICEITVSSAPDELSLHIVLICWHADWWTKVEVGRIRGRSEQSCMISKMLNAIEPLFFFFHTDQRTAEACSFCRPLSLPLFLPPIPKMYVQIAFTPPFSLQIIPLLISPLRPTTASARPKMQKPVAVPTPQIPKPFRAT